MGSFFSLLQGVLFAAMNTAILAFVMQEVVSEHVGVALAPRMLVLFAGVMFLLGMVFMECLSVRRAPGTAPGLIESGTGLRAGPLGSFVAAVAAMYTTAMAVMITGEMVLMYIPVVFALYVFASAQATSPSRSRFAAPFSALAVLVVALVAFEQTNYSDQMADSFSRYFDLEKSAKTDGYLEETGGAFSVPFVTPMVLASTAFALVYSSTLVDPARAWSMVQS